MSFTGVTIVFCLILFNLFHLTKCGDWTNQTLKGSTQQALCNLGCICEGPTVFLDCTGRNITKLPFMITFAPETEAVNFQENSITSIIEGTFFNDIKITELDFSHNKITHIDDLVFRPLPSLQVLRLSHNNISNLTPTTLSGLSKLATLEISHNNLQELPVGFFIHTLSLQELKLQFNKFNSLPNTTFQYLIHLEKLDLEGNQLKNLPGDLFSKMSRLQTLSLANNRFEVVPMEALAHAKSLHFLDLSKNIFRTLPPGSFFKLFNIATLYLNDLPELSRVEENAFAGLTKLKVLSCSYNKKLTFFHPDAFSHSKISQSMVYPREELLLRENALTTLQEPLHIETWFKLNHVDFANNPWRCDCKIRWMIRLRRNVAENIRCESPFLMHGRTIHSLTEEEMVCEYHWMFSTVILVITSLLAFFVCIGMVILIACYNTSLGRSIRSYSQFSYKKFSPKKEEEMLDLDWDPTLM